MSSVQQHGGDIDNCRYVIREKMMLEFRNVKVLAIYFTVIELSFCARGWNYLYKALHYNALLQIET